MAYCKHLDKHTNTHTNTYTYRTKKPKVAKTWDRDALCIPKQRNRHTIGGIMYTRRKYRAYLSSSGLFGKLHLTSEMSDEDVK